MPEKLTALFNLFKNARQKDESTLSPQVTSLIEEILGAFGLPPNQGYEMFVLEFCGAEVITEDAINETLIRLGDEGAYQMTLDRLAGG